MLDKLCLILLIIIFSGFKERKSIEESIKQDIPYLKSLYLDIHKNPEISLMEKETSKKLANELEKIGFKVTRNFGGYGVVGIFKNGNGPTILYRTDMDALPMKEKTGLSYASQIITFTFPHIGIVGTNKIDVESSKIHACGCVLNQPLGISSSWRSNKDLDFFFIKNNIAVQRL